MTDAVTDAVTEYRPTFALRSRRLRLLAALCLLGAPSALAQGGGTVLEVAAETPEFSTLINVLDAAGLTETLQGDGPFTIFAPTNEAFARLPAGELDALLADRSALAQRLSYHVVPGSFTTADITADMTGFTTLTGDELPITQEGVGDAAVTAVNIPAANGVVFAIDTVLTPPLAEAGTEPGGETGGLYSSTAEASERYELLEVAGSGVSGSALVAEYRGGRAVVTVSLNDLNPDGVYPAELSTGSCDPSSLQETGQNVADLEDISGALGFSTTTLSVSYADVTTGDHKLVIFGGRETDAAIACSEVGL